jgi:hypothetical protein
MRQRAALLLASAMVVGCAAAVAPDVLQQWQTRQLYTCCNLHYEDPAKISDANYSVGSILPFGSAASVMAMTNKSVTFRSDATDFTVTQSYGRAQESAQQYFAKLLVDTDPRTHYATFSPSVQAAIRDGQVERGMTREQVLMALGYPATHRTASTDAGTWVYWYNRWVTYHVHFGLDGLVTRIVGGVAPSNNEPVQQAVVETPTPQPAAPKKRKH